MSNISDEDPPDAELRRLVSRFLDQTLTDVERDRLEERLRSEPAAHRYCADSIRFDATLQEALGPQSLEWEETRRVRLDTRRGAPFLSVQREQTVRFGGSEPSPSPANVRLKHKWWLGGLLLVLVATGVYFYQQQRDSYSLRNGDFEAMDLSQNPTGVDRSILYWQDFFTTPDAELCEVGRVSGGQFFAKSGRNAVRLRNRAYINQIILNKNGSLLKAVAELRVVVTGWGYSNARSAHTLRGSLRYVASGNPNMIQYEVANTTVSVECSGWQRFRMELVLPANLSVPASDTSGNGAAAPPFINVQDKGLTLSLDDRSKEGELFLDDLKLEVIQPAN